MKNRLFILVLIILFSCTHVHQKKEVKIFSAFENIPITCIQPEGWLKVFLQNQKNGLTGHLEYAGYPFNACGWNGRDSDRCHNSWWPYEQNGYWMDGMIRCGLLLNDTFLINKALQSINYTLEHADSSGFLGPDSLKNSSQQSRWPNAVFFRSLMAYGDATDDQRVIDRLLKHYSDSFPYTSEREEVNLENLLWLYKKTADTMLLKKAETIYAKAEVINQNLVTSAKGFLKDEPSNGHHGVTYNERAKLGAILYMYTGKKEYLDPSIAAYKKLDKYHMLIDGVNVSTEELHPVTPLESHEICDISDYTWSVGYLLMATGNADYADKIERAMFNALPGAVTSDFKALQYFSSPNQVIATHYSNHNAYCCGNAAMSYSPNPFTSCCPGNVNRAMPNFASRLWMDNGKGGIVAAMYAPCRVLYPVGKDKQKITIEEETNYPFSDTITFIVKTESQIKFPFTLRIPQWCNNAGLLINHHVQDLKASPGTYFDLDRIFENNDIVQLVLPQHLKLSHWPGNGVAIEKGPLVYSLKIEEDKKINTGDKQFTKEFPAWDIYPKSAWNYALCIDSSDLDKIICINNTVKENPWDEANPPIELKVPAKKIKNWDLVKTSIVKRAGWKSEKIEGKDVWAIRHWDQKGDFIFTPGLPEKRDLKKRLSEQTDTVTLVPFGCTRLRLTIFPDASDLKIK